jgi:amino acid transporter
MPSKYNRISESEDTRTLKPEVHPIWNGIGFALIILIPILAYFGAIELLNLNTKYQWVRIPQELIIYKLPDHLLLVKIILIIVLIFLLAIIFSAITFFLYSLFVPTRYGPMDVPYLRYKGKRYKR